VLLLGQPDKAKPIFVQQAPAFEPALAIEALAQPLSAMRPGRVYAWEEMRAFARPLTTGITHARMLRVAVREDLHAWALLLDERSDFTAADSALLSALAPHLTLAIETALRFDVLRLRAGMAEDALAMLGIAQAALDSDGHVIAGALPGEDAARAPTQSLARACVEIAGEPARTRRVLPLEDHGVPTLLLRPAASYGVAIQPAPAAIATLRQARREEAVSGARILAATLGISAREAQLAEALSRGQGLVAAGASLGLTAETARSYSKRIYAKTGTSGQADLVRLVLTGLAPLG